MLREKTNPKTGEKDYAAATGSKGYRWLEAEMVRELGKEKDIDRAYYDKMVQEAVDSIGAYGDVEWFISDDPYCKKEDSAPWCMPCGNDKYSNCSECPNFHKDKFHMDCNLGFDISEILNKNN